MNPPSGKKSWAVRVVSFFAAVVALAYPFLVLAGWQKINPRLFLAGVMILLGARLWLVRSTMDRDRWREVASPWGIPGVALGVAFFLGRRSLILYWPVAVSAAFLFSFGRTLRTPPSMVERFARLQKSALTSAEITYCRRVTQLWCLFFLGNALIALDLALRSSLKAWAVYTGLISYVLIGTLFAAEYLY